MHAPLLALSLVMAAPAGGAPAGYDTVDALFLASKVQAYYNGIRDFKAKFKQTYSKAYHGPQAPRYGYLWVKKPGLMRWDYAPPQIKQLVCDGKKIWISVPGDKQVFWRDLQESALPTAISFLWGKGNITTEFYVMNVGGSKYATGGNLVLKLLPKQPNSNFKHVLFTVNPRTGMVAESRLYDHLNNVNHYVFSEAVTNTNIPPSQFQFKIPPGSRVIKATDDVKP